MAASIFPIILFERCGSCQLSFFKSYTSKSRCYRVNKLDTKRESMGIFIIGIVGVVALFSLVVSGLIISLSFATTINNKGVTH